MLQYHMPAEWQPHECCWMAWPCNESLWRAEIEKAWQNYAAVANAIAHFEPVKMLARPEHCEQARALLREDIVVLPWQLDDSWMRDFGPTFVYNQASSNLAGVDWTFNGWGKFPHEQDQHVAHRLLDHLGLEKIACAMVNEGGAIHVDGEGTCLLTRNVQLNGNRNPNLSQADVEYHLRHTLGIKKCIWFDEGLYEDHTDGHVDQFACFTAPGKAVALTCSVTDDPNFAILGKNLGHLQNATDVHGNTISVATIEQPPSEYYFGERLGKSYINFYIANGGIVMPSYGMSDYDSNAVAVLQTCFPDREIVAVDCSVLVTGGGNIHCITQQQPKS